MAANSSLIFSNSTLLHKNTPNPTSFPRHSPISISISFPSIIQSHSFKSSFHSHLLPSPNLLLCNNNGGSGSGNNNNNFWGRRWWNNDDDNSNSNSNSNSDSVFPPLLFLASVLIYFWNSKLNPAFALEDTKGDAVWEVRGGKWTKLLPNQINDDFDVVGASRFANGDAHESMMINTGFNLWSRCRDLFLQLMLPDGYPNSVSSDFLEYSLWRGVQGVASQVSAVLATQALLYAIGLGKGAIPTAAAINWVLKDGIGYCSKIFLSKYGRHFDVNPKGWRLFADLLENAAFGLEILTPAFPHLFVYIGAVAGAGRSAATLIQAATRSCFFAGFAAQRNFAEVIAKGEAQGMVSKSIGIVLGIALANWIGTSTPLALTTFTAVTVIHMYTNLKSYQAILLKTLNPYRASLVFSEYLLSGEVPHIKEVNDEEPIFAGMPLINASLKGETQSQLLSPEAKTAAIEIERRLQLGSKLSDTVTSKNDAGALFDLYKNEGYLLTEHRGKYCVVLKEGYTPQDMLKSLFHVNYLYWLEKNVGIETKGAENDCKAGGKLQISLDYVQREFEHVKRDGSLAGWVLDGLVARPSSCRVREGRVLVSAPVS